MLWFIDSGLKKGTPFKDKTVLPDGKGKNREYEINYSGKEFVQATIRFENGNTGLVSYQLSDEKEGSPKIKTRVLLGEPTVSSNGKSLLFPVLSSNTNLKYLCVRAEEFGNKTCVSTDNMPSILELINPKERLHVTIFETEDTQI